MSYVYAAYGITVITLGVYAIRTLARGRALKKYFKK